MVKFITPKDVDFFKSINKEVYNLFFQEVPILRVKDTEYDELYRENMNPQWEEPYTLPGYIPALAEWRLKLTKFGADEERTLTIFFSIDVATERQVPLPDIGDRFIVQNDTYQINQVNPTDFGSNLQIPLTHICVAIKVRATNPEEGTEVTEEF